MKKIDFSIIGDNSVYLLTPRSDECKNWCEEKINIFTEDHSGVYDNIAVESRYIEDITRGLLKEGFKGTKDGMRLSIAKDGTIVCNMSNVKIGHVKVNIVGE